MAGELDRLLTATEQATLLTDAAARLGSIDGDEDPVVAAFARFQRVGLIGQYRKSPWSIDGAGTRSVVVDLDAYALSPSEERLPVLPIVLDLFRRRFDRHVPQVRAAKRANGWRVVFELATGGTADGLACAPIEEGI